MASVRTSKRKGDDAGKEASGAETGADVSVAAVRARVTSKGQVTIPKAVREQLGIRPGDSLEFRFDGDRLHVRPVRRKSISEFFAIFPPKPGVDTSMPWEEQRRIAWEAMTRRLVYPPPPDDDE